jgi:hypothetical protein
VTVSLLIDQETHNLLASFFSSFLFPFLGQELDEAALGPSLVEDAPNAVGKNTQISRIK